MYRNIAFRKLFVNSWLQLKVHATKIGMTLLAKVGIQICTETQLLRSYLLTLESWLQLGMKLQQQRYG